MHGQLLCSQNVHSLHSFGCTSVWNKQIINSIDLNPISSHFTPRFVNRFHLFDLSAPDPRSPGSIGTMYYSNPITDCSF